jgi:hypothetical protein
MGKQFNNRNSQVGKQTTMDSITLGTVMATNDPHQMGRLKILCPTLGDNPDDLQGENLPWATYVSPLGGMVNSDFKRGPSVGLSSKGPVAYGLWGIPKRGATVLVCCVDGDPYYRVWLGCVFDQGAVSSLPHGRFFYKGKSGTPDGPFDSYEDPIEPLYSNMQKAFKDANGYEWRTRGADYSATGNTAEHVDTSPSDKADETQLTPFTSNDGKTFDVKNGYAVNQNGEAGDDSSVYSWTTPGFHSFSMDDRPENCRVRVRTTSGAQILMDDTNERIYISTPKGDNWVEMDYDGNIDMYGKRVSVRAETDINFTAGETIRMYADKGIHMVSKAEVSIQATDNINIKTDAGLEVKAEAAVNVQSGAALSLKASGNILQTGSQIHMNGQAAASASPEEAKLTNRLPSHEPFARVMTKDDTTHEPEFPYDDPAVGTSERGTSIPRGKHWRR